MGCTLYYVKIKMNVTCCRSKLAAQSYWAQKGICYNRGEQCVSCVCVWSRLWGELAAHDIGIMTGNQVREFLVFVCIYTPWSLPNGLISFFPPDKRKKLSNYLGELNKRVIKFAALLQHWEMNILNNWWQPSGRCRSKSQARFIPSYRYGAHHERQPPSKL